MRLDTQSCDTETVMLKRFAALALVCTLSLLNVPFARATAYDDHPKLVIILVLDQFRADYLERYRADFKTRGFNLFLTHGAWFPDCYYDYANTETAPGHANSVAVALDHEEWPEVVGTIAGDDTILVIAPDRETAEVIQEKLMGILETS